MQAFFFSKEEPEILRLLFLFFGEELRK